MYKILGIIDYGTMIIDYACENIGIIDYTSSIIDYDVSILQEIQELRWPSTSTACHHEILQQHTTHWIDHPPQTSSTFVHRKAESWGRRRPFFCLQRLQPLPYNGKSKSLNSQTVKIPLWKLRRISDKRWEESLWKLCVLHAAW